ncbi:putative tail protein [Ralstonia phage phiRSP]|uniref:Putative tail protein n=1 Tax=Ralstonia phage phiRSP TaxID=2201420 RepID=A0A345ANU1_9CAUD|nr:tail protein [Ralstonia phage phiRSP]AXF38230.1 putative tail protein [Ralstonia phage phiRSP]
MSLAGFLSGFVPMLRLGDFNFSLHVAVAQEMRRRAEYKWPSQERFGQLPARQFTGPGDESITLPGVIYPQWRGSANAMAQLRAMGARGQPYLLMDAQGKMYGRWVITDVEEVSSAFAAFTVPRKIEFNVTLQRFDGSDSSVLGTLLDNALQSAGIQL